MNIITLVLTNLSTDSSTRG